MEVDDCQLGEMGKELDVEIGSDAFRCCKLDPLEILAFLTDKFCLDVS